MQDSIAIVNHHGFAILTAGILVGFSSLVLLFVILLWWKPLAGAWRTILVGFTVAAVVAAVPLYVHGEGLKSREDAEQATAVSRAWGLSRPDAVALVQSAKKAAGSYVRLDGATQKLTLADQQGRYLLVRDTSKAIPIKR